MPGAWAGLKTAWAEEPDGVLAVLSIADGWPDPARQKQELARVIEVESGWNPTAMNMVSSASGLIQFMPSTAKKLGTTVEAIREMTRLEQAPWVAKFFHNGPTPKLPGDVYIAVFAPGFVGHGDDEVMYAAGTPAALQNKGLADADGNIRVGTVRAIGIPSTPMPDRTGAAVVVPTKGKKVAAALALVGSALGIGFFTWRLR